MGMGLLQVVITLVIIMLLVKPVLVAWYIFDINNRTNPSKINYFLGRTVTLLLFDPE
ncbi:hypothetical protein [Paenibacillus aestuarii]|uniref:Uncharacterized protein n=1 Tax=Paenibacillus aestuarii TaxID=516965 RepID=A0ABW0KFU6_9BACL|nr:hypothetical protein [Paenibacillus aestuarii]